eukprot:3836785-Amphidinium_carterae.1
MLPMTSIRTKLSHHASLAARVEHRRHAQPVEHVQQEGEEVGWARRRPQVVLAAVAGDERDKGACHVEEPGKVALMPRATELLP